MFKVQTTAERIFPQHQHLFLGSELVQVSVFGPQSNHDELQQQGWGPVGGNLGSSPLEDIHTFLVVPDELDQPPQVDSDPGQCCVLTHVSGPCV